MFFYSPVSYCNIYVLHNSWSKVNAATDEPEPWTTPIRTRVLCTRIRTLAHTRARTGAIYNSLFLQAPLPPSLSSLYCCDKASAITSVCEQPRLLSAHSVSCHGESVMTYRAARWWLSVRVCLCAFWWQRDRRNKVVGGGRTDTW